MRFKPDHYILDKNHKAVLVDTCTEKGLIAWGRWYEKSQNRIVKQEDVDKYWVSTIFLALDHNYSFAGPPILFETMVFTKDRKADYDGGRNSWRCSTWEQALVQHQAVVAIVQAHAARKAG